MRKMLILGGCMLLMGCTASDPNKQWEYAQSLSLEGINPIGLTATENGLWMSDGDHNRLARIDERGGIVQEVTGLDRPMHIGSEGNRIYIPQYGNDQILRWSAEDSVVINIPEALDAPAGVSVADKTMAIADFYNHRILYYDGNDWLLFGEEGKDDGAFYYPTDVQLAYEKVWVADAYNNRGQVFDTSGKHVLTFGADQKMNAATGLYVSKDQVFLTDFENDRVIVFTHEGKQVQILERAIEKPTDVMVWKGRLYITNYRTGELVMYD